MMGVWDSVKGVGGKVTGAVKGGVQRLEETQKRLEPYEKKAWEGAKELEHRAEVGAKNIYAAEKKAWPKQKRFVKKVGKKAREEVEAGVALERKMWPTQKKVAQAGVEFLSKGFKEAYGDKGLFGGVEENISEGLESKPIQSMRRVKQRKLAPEEYEQSEGPRNFMDDYMEKYEKEFWTEANPDRKMSVKTFRKEVKTPIERYLAAYEKKMAKRGL